MHIIPSYRYVAYDRVLIASFYSHFVQCSSHILIPNVTFGRIVKFHQNWGTSRAMCDENLGVSKSDCNRKTVFQHDAFLHCENFETGSPFKNIFLNTFHYKTQKLENMKLSTVALAMIAAVSAQGCNEKCGQELNKCKSGCGSSASCWERCNQNYYKCLDRC